MSSMEFFLVSLLLFIIAVESQNHAGITVDLIHRDSPRSPSYDPSLTPFERLRKSIDRSNKRKDSLTRIYLRATSASRQSFDAPLFPNGGSYLMQYKLGSPPQPITAIADTGSDLIWTQCAPCISCYNQTAPLFNSIKSNSYKSIFCFKRVCYSNYFSCDFPSFGCEYQYSYGDGSYTIGDIATETVTFNSSNGVTTSFPKVSIGCGRDNAGTFSADSSGIVGLGGGPLSLINQANSKLGGKFSYCLTEFDFAAAPNSSVSSSKINFGPGAVVTGPDVVSTPLVTKAPVTYYYVTLVAITVNLQRINYTRVPVPVAEQGNIILDSGTTLTYLPDTLYRKVLAAINKAVGETGDSVDGFVCYNSTEALLNVVVTVHFSGADLKLEAARIFLPIVEGKQCLVFVSAGIGGLAIYGNIQQANFIIAYDLSKAKARQVHILPTDCSKQS